MKTSFQFLFISFLSVTYNLGALTPVVLDNKYIQRLDHDGNLTKLVDIQYDLEVNRSMFEELFFNPDGAENFPVICTVSTGDVFKSHNDH